MLIEAAMLPRNLSAVSVRTLIPFYYGSGSGSATPVLLRALRDNLVWRGGAVRQVVFTDVLIVGRLDVHGQSFAPIGLHKIDAASDWLLRKRVCIGMKGLPGVQLQN